MTDREMLAKCQEHFVLLAELAAYRGATPIMNGTSVEIRKWIAMHTEAMRMAETVHSHLTA